MELRELRPGLWRWTSWHEEWQEAVGSVAYEAPGDLVLFDPLLEREDELDDLVRRVDKPVTVLVTVFWHTRSAAKVVRRHGARVLAPSRGLAPVRRRAGTAEPYRPGDSLPGGVEAIATARATEVVFWIPAHRALVAGDVVLGGKNGGLRLCPASWLPVRVSLDALAASLRPALELPVARVLVSHREPVLRHGREALARALRSPRHASYTSS
jgi:glyoxylase-like metal-dependent hydrolase (beta-lactamase superfamily II)